MNETIDYKAQAKKLWNNDPCGAVYAREFEQGTKEFYEKVEAYRYNDYAPWIKKFVPFSEFKGKKVLEIGAGLGTDLLQFARAGAFCTDLDLSETHLELAQKRFALYGFTGTFVLGDAENLPFDDSSFDGVFSNGVLHHTPNTQKAIDEVYRVLKPNGKAMIMLYHKQSFFYWYHLVFGKGIVGGLYRKGFTTQDLLNRFVEYTESDALPLVKCYTKAECKQMFSKFKSIDLKVCQFTKSDIPYIGKFTPQFIIDALGSVIGWNIYITAVK
ncbi:MAG: class I SAM-dependent methyltransferase [Candidatus Thermochlorobacter sp.]